MNLSSLARLRQKYAPPPTIFYPTYRITDWHATQRSVDPYVGYRALWMKVIIRAGFDWVSYRDVTKLEQRKEAERAYKWLFEASELFNSFENICHLVDLPPEKIRRWVRALTKEHVAKIEHLERESTNPIALLEAERRMIEEQDLEDS
jgi:hypothetical protein